MRTAIVEFIVQVPDDDGNPIGLMNQAEMYLNNGDRCVDFNIRELDKDEFGSNIWKGRIESIRDPGHPVIAKHLPKRKRAMKRSSEQIANETWRQGFVHLTVDGEGLVSLWDDRLETLGYVRLDLTKEQQELLEQVRQRGGHTP